MRLPFAKKPSTLPSVTAVSIPESKFYVRHTLDASTLLAARNSFLNGQLTPMLQAYSTFFHEDDSVASACDVRAEALKTASVSFDTQNLSQLQIDYFSSVIKRFAPIWADLLLELKLTGALFRQIRYEFVDGFYYPAEYLAYPKADLRIHDGALTPFSEGKPLSLDPLRFINLTRDTAVFYSILRYNVFFSFAINNWAQFCETFGKPPRIAKYKPGTTESEKNQLLAMLQNFGTDLSAMISDNVVIDFADFVNKNANAELYHSLCEFCDDRITRRILGNTLTTKAVATGGSYAQASIHELVRSDILAGDCRDLDTFITSRLNPLNLINFGRSDLEVTVAPKPKINLLDRIQIDTKLYNDIGIDFPEDYWHRTYNVPLPERQ